METAAPSIIPRNASLYVGDLQPEVTEIDLIQKFSQIAPLASVRICRDRFSFKSLRYGYVNFLHPFDAFRALVCLNHTEMKGKTMRIMWWQRNPVSRNNIIANLYVKNLVPSVTSAQLEGIFCKYGTILSCKVAEDNNGKSKGFGFVQFDKEDSAIAAINALHGTMLEGKQLHVCKFVNKSGRNGTSEETFRNLYVKNLDENISEDILREKFSEHGKVCRISIMKDKEGKSRGFGFVEFSTHEEATKALECLNGVLLGSKNFFLSRARQKEEREQNLRSMRNTNVWIDDKKLEEIFNPYGKIISAGVMHCDHDGVSKRLGLVRFSGPEQANNALEALNGGTAIQGLSLHKAWSQSSEEHNLERCWAPYPTQSFLYPEYLPLYYNIPPAPVSFFQPNQYQNCASGMSTCRAQNHWGKFSLNPLKSTTSYAMKQEKPSIILGKENASCEKPASLSLSVRPLPQWILKKKNVKMLNPHLDDIEGDVAKAESQEDSFTKQVKQALQLVQELGSQIIPD